MPDCSTLLDNGLGSHWERIYVMHTYLSIELKNDKWGMNCEWRMIGPYKSGQLHETVSGDDKMEWCYGISINLN